jgi:NADPH:quinone reductase-like Zn-dependent oxidoreductase
MRAFAIDHPHTTGSVHDLPLPDIAPNEVLIRVTAAGVNPVDWKIRDRDTGGPFPLVLGQDFAGLVVGTGNKVTRYATNDRVFGIARKHGAYAQYTVVPEDSNDEPIAKIPASIGDADAAALPTAGLTALGSLDVLQIKNGSVLLINGAAGGVGGFASQIAHGQGAYVIGTMHSGKENFARSLGVDEPVAYDRDDVVATVSAKHPGGVDALLDLVSDTEGMKHLGSLIRPGGKAVSTIGSADKTWFRQQGVDAENAVMSHTPASSNAGLRELARLVEDGTIHVVITAERELDDAAQALELSKSGTVDGKIVLTVS